MERTVGIDARSLGGGTGIGRYLKCIIKHIFKASENIQYVLFINDEKGERLIHEIVDVGKNVKIINYRSKTQHLKTKLRVPIDDQCNMRKAINQAYIDVMYSPYFDLPVCMKLPAIVTIHDISIFLLRECYTKMQVIYYVALMKYFAKNAKCIITDTQSGKLDLMTHLHVQEEKIRVIYPGMPWTTNAIDEEQALEVLPKYFILYTGGIAPRKNIENLLMAFALFSTRTKEDYFLFITGPDSKYRTILKNLANELCILNKVKFVGVVSEDELKRLYKNARLVVYPSLYEGFGFPILEAMASRVPIIASNISSMPEIIRNENLLFNPLDTNEIAVKMLMITENEDYRRAVVDHGLDIIKEFDWHTTSGELISIFMDILNERC